MTLKDNNTPSLSSCYAADHLIVHLPISPANLAHLALGNAWAAPVNVVEDPKGLLPLAGLPSLQVDLDFFLLYCPSTNYMGPRRGFQSFIFKFPSFDIANWSYFYKGLECHIRFCSTTIWYWAVHPVLWGCDCAPLRRLEGSSVVDCAKLLPYTLSKRIARENCYSQFDAVEIINKLYSNLCSYLANFLVNRFFIIFSKTIKLARICQSFTLKFISIKI